MDNVSETKRCPFCAEQIKVAAKKCRFCGSFLNDSNAPVRQVSSIQREPSPPTQQQKPSGLDVFLQFLKSLEQLASAGLGLTVLIALILIMRGCS